MKNEITTSTEQVNNIMLVNYLNIMGLTPKLTKEEQEQFINISKMYGLNPFKREIYCTVYGEGQYKQFSIITGYEVYIKRAERSGLLDGWNAVTTGSIASNDLKAVVTIYRKDRQHPFVWEAFYEECVQKTKAGVVTKFWEKANFMTKKVAISQAFRLCFSDELGGMPYTSDEINQEGNTHDIPHEEMPPVLVLSNTQLETLLGKASAGRLAQVLNKIEQGELQATQVQVLQLETKLKQLKNE